MTIYRIDGRSTTSKYAVDIIKAAPGYTSGGTYDILKAKSGGYRVYKIVGDKAWDASLADISDIPTSVVCGPDGEKLYEREYRR